MNLLTIYLEVAGILVFEVKKSFAVEVSIRLKTVAFARLDVPWN